MTNHVLQVRSCYRVQSRKNRGDILCWTTSNPRVLSESSNIISKTSIIKHYACEETGREIRIAYSCSQWRQPIVVCGIHRRFQDDKLLIHENAKSQLNNGRRSHWQRLELNLFIKGLSSWCLPEEIFLAKTKEPMNITSTCLLISWHGYCSKLSTL